MPSPIRATRFTALAAVASLLLTACGKQWLEFVLSPEGQAVYATKGFRPLSSVDGVEIGEVEGANDPANPYPDVATLWTIEDDFGGWPAINDEFFDQDSGIITQLQHEAGLS